MWTRKTPQELAVELLARQLVNGACALVVAFLLLVSVLPGNVLFIMPSARIVAAVFAAIVLLFCRWRAREYRDNVMYCEQCRRSARVNQTQGPCACGGKLTPMREMKWIDQPPRESDSSHASAPEEPIRMSCAL